MSIINSIETFHTLQQDADHVDIKTIEGAVTLREFIAGTLTYYPAWIKALYVIRAGFVRLLGMTQENMTIQKLTPETTPFETGDMATFFQVYDAQENHYWVASASDKHLDAYLGVMQEPLDNGLSRFHVVTIVHYNNWAGPIYFNIIRPFHHVVVRSMMQAGIRYQRKPSAKQYA